ncbi:MAG: SPOR domain-containing protein [Bacteroidota bacterium]
MRLDALLPVILIACLLALAYFLTKAVQAANAEAAPPTTQVRLNPDDYRDGATDSGTASTDDSGSGATASGSAETADLDHLYESPAASPNTSDRAATTGESYSPPATNSGSTTSADNSSATNSATSPSNNTAGSSSGNTSAASRRASTGKYIVVTGSYRQRANAERQVANLKREGFPDAEVEIFDRGTYALAVADRFNSRSDAEALTRRLVSSGFEAYVKEL